MRTQVRTHKLTLDDGMHAYSLTSNGAWLLQERTELLVGDVLLSAACIAYYGAFPGDYRQELVSGWVDKCKEHGIPVSPDCTLRGTLASPIQVNNP